jgi:alpha-L-rhamnosidase
MITIERLAVEHYESGLGIDTPRPRLSWRFNSDPQDERDKDWEQAAYELEIVDQDHLQAQTSAKVDDANSSQTHHVVSSQSVLVPWPAAASTLDSRSRRTVRVRAQSTLEVWTPWSEPLLLETGLLKREDWLVPFITGPPQTKGENKRPFYFRARFLSPSAASRARLYITARGVYEAHLNGQPVSDQVLAPGWQSYSHRLAYQTFDVTQLLDSNVGAENTIGVILGEGWYSGRLGYRGGINDIWGDRMAVLVQLEIDGKPVEYGEDWTWSYGPILSSGIYDGEVYDGSLVDPQWSTSSPSHTESKALGTGPWLPVEMLPLDGPLPSTPQSPPIRRTQEIKPIEIITTPSGQTVLDMGQNMVGWLRWNTSGPGIDLNPGSTHEVTLQHAEVLELGELGTRPLRHAAATETVRLSPGVSMQGYEPKFTFHGFRYVQVTGWPGLTLDDLTGIVVHTDMERLGEFSCSHSWLNRLHDNVVWGMRGNFLSVPTDCPQR